MIIIKILFYISYKSHTLMIPLNGYTASAYKHNIKVITKTALYTNCANLM